MPNCHWRRCVFGCSTKDVSIHDFPNPERFPDQYKLWIEIAGESLKNLTMNQIYRKKKVCQVHFTKRDWNRNNRLNALAVPSLHLPGQKNSRNTKIEDVKSNSKELKYFLSDHTYSLPEGPRVYVSVEKKPAKDDSVIDLNTRVEDTTVDFSVKDLCDDNANYDDWHDDDVVVPDTPVIEAEILPQEKYSWEKTDVIVADDHEDELTLDLGDVSMYNDVQTSKDYDTGGEFAEYQCNECGNTIKGFRYTCVQCADWDLCGACEARAAHDTHYVLRVPGQRPYKEMQAILAAIRQQMLREDLFLAEVVESIKEEVKVEDAEVPEGAPEVEADPLAAWDISQPDDDCDTLEIYPEQQDEDDRPPRKRRRTSLCSLPNSQNFTPRDDSSYNNLATMTDDVLMETNKDGMSSDDDQTCDPRFDYSEPIEIIDIDKLIKTQEQTEQLSKNNDSDTIQITKESCIDMSLDRYASPRDNILDTRELNVQHNKREELVDVSTPKTPLKTFQLSSHTQEDTHGVRIIGPRSKTMGTDGKGIVTREEIARHSKATGPHNAGTGTLSQTRKGTLGKGIGTQSVANANTDNRIKKRYKILLPPGAHWKKLLMTMLKSRATVQVEDVMRKIVHKKTEINEI